MISGAFEDAIRRFQDRTQWSKSNKYFVKVHSKLSPPRYFVVIFVAAGAGAAPAVSTFKTRS